MYNSVDTRVVVPLTVGAAAAVDYAKSDAICYLNGRPIN